MCKNRKKYFIFILISIFSARLYSQDIQKSTYDTATLRSEIGTHESELVQFDIDSGKKYIPRYEEGQGSVSLGGGVVFPLFFQKYTGDIVDANLSIGGHVWFEWDLYLWRGLSTGMEISGMFSQTKNSRTLFMAPITAHIKYTFQIFPVEFPISLAFGMNMASLEEIFKIDFILKPKVGTSYRINQNWTVGLFTSYWFIVQDYNSTLGSEYSRLGNFIDTTAGFSYVF